MTNLIDKERPLTRRIRESNWVRGDARETRRKIPEFTVGSLERLEGMNRRAREQPQVFLDRHFDVRADVEHHGGAWDTTSLT